MNKRLLSGILLLSSIATAQSMDYRNQIKNKPFVTVTDAPFNAKCDGGTDDHTAIQTAINTGKAVHFPGICGSSTKITLAVNGQQLIGDCPGCGIIATDTISGPLFNLNYLYARLDSITFDANHKATYAMLMNCGYQAIIINSHFVNATSDGVPITLSASGYTTCAGGTATNDGATFLNSYVDNNAGIGIHYGNQAADINNNNIQFINMHATGNTLGGITGNGSSGHIKGGNWSNNGTNATSTAGYCIRLGEGSTISAVNWTIDDNPDIETCNFNTTLNQYRGAQILFDTYSQVNTITLSGSITNFCNTANTPSCTLWDIGSNIWHAVGLAGITDIVGTGTTTFPNYLLYDHYTSTSHPLLGIPGAATGHKPIFYGLKGASVDAKIVIDSSGQTDVRENATSTGQITNLATPFQTCNSTTIYCYAQYPATNIFLNGSPKQWEEHWIYNSELSGGHSITIVGVTGGSTNPTLADGKWQHIIWRAGVWAANTAYATTTGTVTSAIVVGSGHFQICTVSGTSGSSTPSWNTSGSTTTDGTVTWQDLGATTWDVLGSN